MATLSRRERVIVGAGAVVALAVGGYLFLVEPLVARARDAQALVPAREATLERRRLLVAPAAAARGGAGRRDRAARDRVGPPPPRADAAAGGLRAAEAGQGAAAARAASRSGASASCRRPTTRACWRSASSSPSSGASATPSPLLARLERTRPAARAQGRQDPRGRRRPAARAADHAHRGRLPPPARPGTTSSMSRRLLVVNVSLGLAACLLAAGHRRELLAPLPLPPPAAPRAAARPRRRRRAAPSTAPPAAGGLRASSWPRTSSARRARNPGRARVAAGPKPVLHGVVMDGPKSRAYLEDPLPSAFGYSVGDAIGGGTRARRSPPIAW